MEKQKLKSFMTKVIASIFSKVVDRERSPLETKTKKSLVRKKKSAFFYPSLEEIFNNFYYKILYSYPFIGDYYINTML